ncbi:MAG: hypothetical protein K2X74_17570 [Acetobacteraceae bacterium]|nr:hypothetical protein [Acetobacteraceae bacterium]
MRRGLVVAVIGLGLLTSPAPAQQPEAEPETEEALPPGPGREDTFHACTPCHATAVIRRSALSRGDWDALMDWMTEKHGMNPLEGELRETIVDYLAGAFPPRRAGRGRNPFLTE